MISPETERPVFRPIGYRPARDEQWEMKQAVIARDGVTTCFWCRQPFASIEEATLEHILPLADGGIHDLRNCTLACQKCNLLNKPKSFIAHLAADIAEKEIRTAINRALNGGELSCDDEIVARFPSVARSFGGKPIKYADAACLLRNIHYQLNQLPPSRQENHLFKGHFNRWLTCQLAQS